MTALGKLFRATAFRLTLAYLVVFAVFAGAILGYVAWNARRLLLDQLRQTIDAELTGLAEQYRTGNIRRIIFIVERRAREPGASLYLVTSFTGDRLAGNVSSVPAGILDQPGEKQIEYARGEDMSAPHQALARVLVLPGGFRLMIGRDIEELDRFNSVIARALGLSLVLIVVLGCLGGWFVTRRILSRVDDMTETARTIMAGDLSGRLPVAGNGDELDRLARNLNAMLVRIGELMTGLKEVSDNIAHDLKTPLTRLRNRVEEALRTARAPEDYRAVLEATIDDSDTLIRLFNALLMIARLEAGQTAETFTGVDAGQMVEGVAELYEPLVEEAGGTLATQAGEDLAFEGSRELVGQALANLVDNAIKYGAEGPDARRPAIRIDAQRNGEMIEIVVSDRGPGIPADARAKAVERFARLEDARTRPGFGLGLSLVTAVAHLHGGSFTLEDNDPGLRAVLRLPAAAGQ